MDIVLLMYNMTILLIQQWFIYIYYKWYLLRENI